MYLSRKWLLLELYFSPVLEFVYFKKDYLAKSSVLSIMYYSFATICLFAEILPGKIEFAWLCEWPHLSLYVTLATKLRRNLLAHALLTVQRLHPVSADDQGISHDVTFSTVVSRDVSDVYYFRSDVTWQIVYLQRTSHDKSYFCSGSICWAV